MTAAHHGGGRERRAASMRRRLLAAAESLAQSTGGLEDLSVARIARAAGVSRATFYIYFEGKPGLLHAWTDEAIAAFGRASRPWMALSASSTFADVRAAVEAIAATYRTRLPLLAVARLEGARDRRLRARLDAAYAAATAAVAGQVAAGQREGWIDPVLPARETAAWGMCMVDRGLEALAGETSREELDRLTGSLAALAWNTLFEGSRPRTGADF